MTRINPTRWGAIAETCGGIVLFTSIAMSPLRADVIPDASLGTERSTVQIDTLGLWTITGGAVRGGNLFHSLDQFSITNGQTAFFNNSAAIQTIITRITGNTGSAIDGLIRTNGTANLFLINPNGIVFGPNARLDMGGSFLATTAHRVTFPDGLELGTTIEATPPLLSVQTPLGVQLDRRPTSITNAGNLAVSADKNITFISRQYSQSGRLFTPIGTISLIAHPGPVSVRLDATIPTSIALLSPQFDRTEGTIALRPGSIIQTQRGGVNATSTGSIALDSARVSSENTSAIAARPITFTTDSLIIRGGATDAQRSRITSQTTSSGEAAAIGLNVNTLSSLNGSIESTTRSTGTAGAVTVTAQGAITLERTAIRSNTDGPGNGNAVSVTASEVSLVRNAGINTFVTSTGNGGSIRVKAPVVLVQNESGIDSTARRNSRGNAGPVTVEADRVTVRNRAGINSNTVGEGNAGAVSVTTRSLLIESQAGVNSDVRAREGNRPSGNGGRVTVKADDITIRNNSGITSNTFSNGNAGPIFVNTNSLTIENKSGINSNANKIDSNTTDPEKISTPENRGNAGPISVTAKTVQINNSSISSETGGQGNAGTITVVTDQLSLTNDGFLTTNARVASRGNAGQIQVTAEEVTIGDRSKINSDTSGPGSGGQVILTVNGALNIRDRSRISVASTPPGTIRAGNAGNITIVADSILLDRESQIRSNAQSANGGNMNLTARDRIVLRRNSQISTTAGTDGSGGNGGNIVMRSPFIIAAPSENSDITANAYQGQGGKVEIFTQGLFWISPLSRQELAALRPTDLDPRKLPSNDITAISQTNPNLNGIVSITTPKVDPSRSLVRLPSTLTDSSKLIAQGCHPRDIADFPISSLTVLGRGGLPMSPDDPLMTDAIATPWMTAESSGKSTKASDPVPVPIVEANDWRRDRQGNVMLVAPIPRSVTEGTIVCVQPSP